MRRARPFRRRTGARKLNRRQRVEVKRIVGRQQEDKFFDVYTGATAVPSGTGVILGPYTVPAQGLTVNSRAGDVIQQRKLDQTYQLNGGDAVNSIRVIVFKWTPNDAFDVPTTAKILQDTVTLPWMSPFIDVSVEQHRFKVISDRLFTMVTASDTGVRLFRSSYFGRRLGKKKQTFNPAATTAAGNIYVLAVSDSIAVAHPNITISSRFHFTDS